ncbi:hypothetical protein H4R18_001721 [Coemansia javaensis]|uniref:Uncharacterized protein n=1 Tax=Coemansia javaensis TaxID=2761396 RepID=A0A9W8LL51_9FUNG|nr:hypothetical protein H4R18_001721 [Coemansia javaensis]
MKYTLLLALLALFTMAAAYQFPTVNASVLAAHLHMFGLDAALPAAAKMHALLVVVAALMFFAASWLGPRLRAEMLIGRLDSHGSDLRQIGVVMYEQHTAIAQLREDIESLQKLLSVELSDMNSRDERIAACSKTIDTLVRQMDTVIMSIKQM